MRGIANGEHAPEAVSKPDRDRYLEDSGPVPALLKLLLIFASFAPFAVRSECLVLR